MRRTLSCETLGRRLVEARTRSRLSQAEAAAISGVGEKTISSFETGERIHAMKFSQLEALLAAYGITLAQFFADDPEPQPRGVEEFGGRELPAIVKILQALELIPAVRAARILHFCLARVAGARPKPGIPPIPRTESRLRIRDIWIH